jgi:hypothetical protein
MRNLFANKCVEGKQHRNDPSGEITLTCKEARKFVFTNIAEDRNYC